MNKPAVCGCVGPAFGEPYCSCKMVSMGIERSDEYKEYILPENIEKRIKESEELFKDLSLDELIKAWKVGASKL